MNPFCIHHETQAQDAIGLFSFQGWSPEGLHRFNKLVKMVQQDRLMDMHFQAQYEIWLKETMSNKSKQKVCKGNHQPIVRAYRDLTSLGV